VSALEVCATYGLPKRLPLTENGAQSPVNPYGYAKLVVERMLTDVEAAHGIRHVALRYFNAAGADPDGDLGVRSAWTMTPLANRCYFLTARHIWSFPP
jgi:UDP-glucose 4-epimerase